MTRAIDRFRRTRRALAIGSVIIGVCLPFVLCVLTGYAFSSLVGAVVVSFLPAATLMLLLIEPRTNAGLRRQLRDTRGAMCPGCAYPLANIQAPACPECGEPWTAETARQAWRRAVGPGWTNLLSSSTDI